MMDWYGTIDRFEGSKAVIIPDESNVTVLMEKSLLPQECREGERLRFSISIEDDNRRSRKKQVQDLIEKLSRGSEE